MKKVYLWTLLALFISWLMYGFLKELAFYTDEFLKTCLNYLSGIGWLAISFGVGWFCEQAWPGKGGLIGGLSFCFGVPATLFFLIVIAKNIFF